ncbi:hypothetical protein BDW68DRAFT_164025, partial [Aspergillus falconensis]
MMPTMAGGAQGLLRAPSPNPDSHTSESPSGVLVEGIHAAGQGLRVATLMGWHMKIVSAMSSLLDTACAVVKSCHIQHEPLFRVSWCASITGMVVPVVSISGISCRRLTEGGQRGHRQRRSQGQSQGRQSSEFERREDAITQQTKWNTPMDLGTLSISIVFRGLNVLLYTVL